MREVFSGEIYRHFKNKLYQIVAVATHSETKEKYVVYQALYGSYETYVRPYDMFVSEVDRIKYPQVTCRYRFEKVDRAELTDNSKPVETAEPASANVQTEERKENTEENAEGVNPLLLDFFNCNNTAEQIEYLSSIRSQADDRLVTDIAVALDITVNDGDVDEKLSSILTCLKTKARFECSRLR